MRAHRVFPALLCITLTLLASAAMSQDENAFDPIAAGSALNDLALQLDSAPDDADMLSGTRSAAAQIAADASACRVQWTDERGRLEERYAPLEEVTGDVSPAVFDQRLEIRQLLDDAIARQTACAGIEDDAAALIERVTSIQNRIAQQYLSYRGESLFSAARQFPSRAQELPDQLRQNNRLALNDDLRPIELFWMLIIGGVVAAAIGVYLRQRFQRWYASNADPDAPPSLRFLFPKPLAEFSPSLLSGLVFVAVLYVAIETPSLDLLVIRLAVGILLFGLGAVAVAWATGPLSPAASVRGLIPDHVAPLRIRLRLVVLSLVASFVVLGTNWSTIRLIEPGAGGRSLMILLVATALLYLIAYLGRIPGLRQRFRLLRVAIAAGLITGIFAVLFGYQNFAGYVVHGITRSMLALFALWVLVWLVSTVLSGLRDEGADATPSRGALGAQSAVSRSSIGFMQVVADLVLWVSVIFYLIYVWDESGTTLDRLIELLVRGGTVGTIQLVPAQIIGGIVIFAALLILIGWIKRWIDRRWLQHIVMERGAREALITLFGYVAFIIALLVGLTQAGVDLRGLAIVSGALALGIGFGLQEIANNFVSGLILLFERPIRAGDFVTVGDIEGFVRKISIRATEIETLDNQNVLVPNSELVSGRVTNWVLRDPHGRIRLEVGVAYGSDVDTVRDILEEVACTHSEVITDGRAPAPRALFMGFGDSSLDFELRCRINRIDRRFSVLSDLNFAIDAAFRKAGISIPFPQRDLHIVSYPETGSDADGEDRKGTDEAATQRFAALPETAVTRQLVQEITINANIKDVWAAIIDADRLSGWFGGTVEFAPYIGGAYRWTSATGSVARGRIDVFIPPQRMRLVQLPPEGEDPLPTGPITVLFALAADDKKTRLTVTVSGIPATEEWEQDYNRSETLWQETLLGIQETLGRS